MDYKSFPNDQTTLIASISRIERQLKLKGYEDKTAQRDYYATLESENHKTIDDKPTKNTLYSTLLYQKKYESNEAEYQSSLKYSNDYEVRKIIEKEVEPYVKVIKADFKNTLNTFQEEVKEFHRNQFDLKSYQETLAANRINANRIENDTKLSFEQINKEHLEMDLVLKDLRDRFSEVNRKVVQMTEEVKNNSERNAMITYLEQRVGEVDQKMNSSEMYKAIEDRIMLQVNRELNTIKHTYDSKMELLGKEKTILEQNSYSLIEECKFKSKDNTKLVQTVNELNKRLNQLESSTEQNAIELSQLNSQYRKNEGEVRKQNEIIDILSHNVNSLREKEKEESQLNRKSISNEEIEELRSYIDSNINQLRETMKNEYNELRSLIDQSTNEIALSNNNNHFNTNIMTNKGFNDILQGTEMSISPELNDKFSTLTEQATAFQTQISTMKSDQLKLTHKLEDINKMTVSNHNIVLNQHEAQFNKIKQEIASLITFFTQYKTEQIKLNDMYEETLKTLATQVFSLQNDSKTLKQDQAGYEDNMETIQDNFEKIKPMIEGFPKIKSDFDLFTQIIQALTKNFEEIKKEVNNNFSSLSQWQSELISNVTSAVNELKQDYNEKFRQSNAVISSGRFDFNNNQIKEDNSKTAELNNKIESLQIISDSKYVAKSELENIRGQIEEMEKKIKESLESKKQIINHPPISSSVPISSSIKKNNQQEVDNNEFFDKDQDWDFGS